MRADRTRSLTGVAAEIVGMEERGTRAREAVAAASWRRDVSRRGERGAARAPRGSRQLIVASA